MRTIIATSFVLLMMSCATPAAGIHDACRDKGGQWVDASEPTNGIIVTILPVRCEYPDARSRILV